MLCLHDGVCESDNRPVEMTITRKKGSNVEKFVEWKISSNAIPLLKCGRETHWMWRPVIALGFKARF